MSNSANLPAPFAGQDTNTPTAVLKSPFCETLYNCNTTDAGISVRNGDAKWSSQSVNTTGGVTIENMAGFVRYGDTKLFIAANCTGGGVKLRYYDISTKLAAPSLAYTSTTNISGTIHTTYFAGRLFTFGSTTATAVGDYYDGTSWGSWGYTMPASFLPLGGCSYKNRQYFIGRDSSDYGYSGIDSVTGTVTKVSLSSVISQQAYLAIITPFTISNEVSAVQLLAFVFFSGEVLFYSGSYPDSTSWTLVGTANISQPLAYNGVIYPYQGDSLVATSTGLISMRDLFLRGSEAAENLALSKSITPDWTALIADITYATPTILSSGGISVSMAWWRAKNKVIVSFPVTSKTSGEGTDPGSTYFVYDNLRLGWSIHRSVGRNPDVSDGIPASVYLTIFNDEALFCGNTIAENTVKIMIKSKENASDFQDVSYDDSTKESYDYTMLSAPIPFPKTAVYEATQIEPILESDLYAETNWNLVADFGRQTSGNQKTDALTTSVAKPAVNVGMQNITYVQVKMSGTTAASKTVGLDLYSYNVWYNSGATGSR